MATIKSYTDISQSKKLTEILPLESADTCWCNSSIKGVNYTDEFTVHIHTTKEVKEVFDGTFSHWDKYWELIPCWSLAALLELLHCNEKDIMSLSHGCYIDGVYTQIYSTDYELEDGNYLHTYADNPIDACYELILKLHEQNLL